MIESAGGDPRKSRETLFEAVRVASAAEDAASEAEAWITLVLVESAGMSDAKEALRWAEHAEIALDRAGGDQTLKGHLSFNVASAHRIVKDYDKSLAKFQDAQALYRHALGEGHYRVARSRGAVGTVLRRLGKLALAEKELRASLARYEELFGPDSPSLGPLLNNLALLLREKRQYQDAKELLSRSLKIKERGLGKDHPGVATALINLALLEQRLGNDDAVEKLWNRSHGIRVKALGDDHPKVTWSLNWWSLYLLNSGRNAEALAMAERAAIRYRSEKGAKSYPLASSLGVQCTLHLRLGRSAKAESMCEQAHAMFESLGDRPSMSLYTDLYRADVAIARKRVAKAEEFLEAAKAKLPKLKGDTALSKGMVALTGARLEAARGRPEDARRLGVEASGFFKELGQGHRYYAGLAEAVAGQP